MDSGEGVQSGKPALSTELPVSGEDLAGRHRPSFFLPIVFWGLFLAGLGLQFFAPHLHVAHDAFVIPQDAMGRGVAIDPVELIRHERQLQLISAMLVVAGAVGLGFYYRRTLSRSISGAGSGTGG